MENHSLIQIWIYKSIQLSRSSTNYDFLIAVLLLSKFYESLVVAHKISISHSEWFWFLQKSLCTNPSWGDTLCPDGNTEISQKKGKAMCDCGYLNLPVKPLKWSTPDLSDFSGKEASAKSWSFVTWCACLLPLGWCNWKPLFHWLRVCFALPVETKSSSLKRIPCPVV